MSLGVILSLIAVAALISNVNCDCGHDHGGNGNGGNQALTITISFESEIICTNHFFQMELTKEIMQRFEKCQIKWVFEPCEDSFICPETHKLKCYGGEEQCALDRMQACAGKLNENDGFHYGIFVACMLNSRDTKNSGPDCAKTASLDWNKIDQCIKCGDGDKYCDEFHKRIMARKPKWIPSIMFDNHYDENTETQAKENFTNTVCSKLKAKGMTCEACNSSPQGDD